MKQITFSEKWDREENLASSGYSTAIRRNDWKTYIKWILVGIIIFLLVSFLGKIL